MWSALVPDENQAEETQHSAVTVEIIGGGDRERHFIYNS